MGRITTTETVERTTGMVCDECNRVYDHNNEDFHISHRFGYGTPLDNWVELNFSLCAECLVNLVLDNVKNAKFIDLQKKKEISHHKIKKLMNIQNKNE